MTPKLNEDAQRLAIYIGESDRWRGKPLYAAILETLKKEKIAGATVVRGVAGFGAHSHIHTAAILRLSEDLPLIIHAIDTPEKIEKAIELVSPMVSEGLVTVEDVRVVRYTHRYLNPLPADRLVEEVMTREVETLSPGMSVAEAWQKMLDTLIKAMPVVDETGQVLGMLTDEDLLERAGVQQRLSVAERLDEQLLAEEIARGVDARYLVQPDEAGSALPGGTGFVETDVSRPSDTQELKVDTALLEDHFFIEPAVGGDFFFGNQFGRASCRERV